MKSCTLPIAQPGTIVATRQMVRNQQDYQVIPQGCICKVLQVEQKSTRYVYLVEHQGLRAWAEASEIAPQTSPVI
jgi:hypothetical protein